MKLLILDIYNRINTILTLIANKVIGVVFKSPEVKGIEESIKIILTEKCSVSRFGDGELWLICGGNIRYQLADKILQSRLKEVLKSNELNHIVTIPDVFEEAKLNLRTNENQLFWREHLKVHRKDWYKFINRKKVYYNTAISRFYIPIKDKSKSIEYLNLWRKIWDKKDVVIIEGEGSRLGVGNDLFDNTLSIERILCPSENAFSKYKQIISEAKKVSKEKLILIALGPTATVLAYDLSKLGFWAIDIGHIDLEYEWFKLGVDKPVKIENKYTNEAIGGNHIHDCNDKKYEKEILCVIK